MASSTLHTQQFALKWNNFHSNLSSGFHELFEAADMVDVTLAVDGKFLQAHKVVLSICSPYFKEMFKVNPCKHPIVILNNVRHEHMKDILEFMYLGEVSVLRENLTSFLRTAELLQVKGLTGDDSSDSSSKEDEKIDCEEVCEEEYSTMLHTLQYQYNSMENHLALPQHYPAPSLITRNPTPPPSVPLPLTLSQPLQMPNMNIPLLVNNNKRPSKSTNAVGTNGKRTKTDNNANQNISSKHTLVPSLKTEGDITGQIRKNVNSGQDPEPEYTDINNMKSERPSIDEETLEKHIVEKSSSTLDNFVDQARCDTCGKFMRKSSLRRHMFDVHCPTQQLPCALCHKRFKTSNSLTTHLITIHRQFKTDRERTKRRKAEYCSFPPLFQEMLSKN